MSTTTTIRSRSRNHRPLTSRKYGVLLLVLGALGLVFSYAFAVLKLLLIADPTMPVQCDQGGVFLCSTVMTSPGSAFLGFPNSFLGISGFAIEILMGVLVLSGAQLPAWVWNGFGLGMRAATALVVLFEIYSLAVVGSICTDCVGVWIITAVGFIYTRAWQAQEGYLRKPRAIDGIVARHRLATCIIWSAIVLVFVLVRALVG